MLTPDEKPAVVPHVRDIEFVATCDECATQARGTFMELAEGGWVNMPGAHKGSEKPVVFYCPGCVTGLQKV